MWACSLLIHSLMLPPPPARARATTIVGLLTSPARTVFFIQQSSTDTHFAHGISRPLTAQERRATNGHALEHYAETKYPLAAKLGTITPDGADVYSYPEDDMVTVRCGSANDWWFGVQGSCRQATVLLREY